MSSHVCHVMPRVAASASARTIARSAPSSHPASESLTSTHLQSHRSTGQFTRSSLNQRTTIQSNSSSSSSAPVRSMHQFASNMRQTHAVSRLHATSRIQPLSASRSTLHLESRRPLHVIAMRTPSRVASLHRIQHAQHQSMTHQLRLGVSSPSLACGHMLQGPASSCLRHFAVHPAQRRPAKEDSLLLKGQSYEVAIQLMKCFIFPDHGEINKDVPISVRLQTALKSKNNQDAIRTLVVFPHATGTSNIVAVFATGEQAKIAREAGADIVGGADLVDAIQQGTVSFTHCLSTPEGMQFAGRVGRILGPKGLMPNLRLGTVTRDVKQLVHRFKKDAAQEIKTDHKKTIQTKFGHTRMSDQQLIENLTTLVQQVTTARPPLPKKVIRKELFLRGTVWAGKGPIIELDLKFLNNVKKQATEADKGKQTTKS